MSKIKFLICLFIVISFSTFTKAQQFRSNESVVETSLKQYLDLASQKEREGDKKEATRFLNEAASIEWEKKNYSQAVQYFQKSIQLNQEIGNQAGILMIHNNLGMIYSDLKDYEKSLIYFNKTLTGRRTMQDKVSIISALVNISVVLNNLKRYQESVNHLEEALDFARNMSDAKQMRSCYGMLAETYEKMGDSNRMLHYFNLYKTFHEVELKGKETKYKEVTEKALLEARVAETEKRYKELEIEKKNLEIQQKNKDISEKEQVISAKDRKVNELIQKFTQQELAIQLLKKDAEIKEQAFRLNDLKAKLLKAEQEIKLKQARSWNNIFITCSVFLALLAGFIFYAYWNKKNTNRQLSYQNKEILKQQTQIIEQKHKLELAFDEIQHKNSNIMASINYASRIQNAVLPKSEIISEYLPEHFIFFKPRDVVSGDFYWFATTKDKVIISAVDCTGHGVPGAFMSMIGDSLMNQIVHDKKIHKADKILSELHKGIKTTLNQSKTENQDGMDMALCVIDFKTQKMEFSGAHNSLVYIQNKQLYEIKGDKFGIGGYLEKEQSELRSFQKQVIDISIPTTFYLFSDGYQDQFGGTQKRKFMVKRLKELFLEIHQKPLQEQAEHLDFILNNWMNGTKQIDDILIIGAKIT